MLIKIFWIVATSHLFFTVILSWRFNTKVSCGQFSALQTYKMLYEAWIKYMFLYMLNSIFSSDICNSAFLWFSFRKQEHFLSFSTALVFKLPTEDRETNSVLSHVYVNLLFIWFSYWHFDLYCLARAELEFASPTRSISSKWPFTGSLLGFQEGCNFPDSTSLETAAAITCAQGFRKFKPQLQCLCLEILQEMAIHQSFPPKHVFSELFWRGNCYNSKNGQ